MAFAPGKPRLVLCVVSVSKATRCAPGWKQQSEARIPAFLAIGATAMCNGYGELLTVRRVRRCHVSSVVLCVEGGFDQNGSISQGKVWMGQDAEYT